MFHYVENKDFLRFMKTTCSDIVNRLVQVINRDDFMEVRAYLVGSGAKNLVMQNENEPVDLDYDLEVIRSKDIRNAHQIKECIRKMFNKVLQANGWGDCSDSTSCLSTKKKKFQNKNTTVFSIDLAIVHKVPDGPWFRLIHQKTGYASNDRWFWNEAPDSKHLNEKATWLKKNDYWAYVRESYKNRKNMYLSRGDRNHPSFICYIETVNEVYDQTN